MGPLWSGSSLGGREAARGWQGQGSGSWYSGVRLVVGVRGPAWRQSCSDLPRRPPSTSPGETRAELGGPVSSSGFYGDCFRGPSSWGEAAGPTRRYSSVWEPSPALPQRCPLLNDPGPAWRGPALHWARAAGRMVRSKWAGGSRIWTESCKRVSRGRDEEDLRWLCPGACVQPSTTGLVPSWTWLWRGGWRVAPKQNRPHGLDWPSRSPSHCPSPPRPPRGGETQPFLPTCIPHAAASLRPLPVTRTAAPHPCEEQPDLHV